MTESLVEDPVLRMRSRFSSGTDAAGQVALRVETWIDPGGGVTPHIHPSMQEHFEVIEGQVEFLSGRRWTALDPGQSVTIAPGTRHAFRNRSSATGRFTCFATPPSSLQEFLEDAAAMSRAGAITRRALPRSLDGLLRAAVLAHHHRDMVTLLAPLPPPCVQRLVMPALARAGRRRGYAPGHLG